MLSLFNSVIELVVMYVRKAKYISFGSHVLAMVVLAVIYLGHIKNCCAM